jgi:hypothetical protein
LSETKKMTPRSIGCLVLAIFGVLLITRAGTAQQMADPHFDATVENPAFTKNFPRVLFDEAHNNFHTVSGRYKPFADLIFSDGYQVVVNRKPFTNLSFKTFKILVIANALGAEDLDEEGADRPAFTEEESDAVRDWVRDGGSLLLIADHAPFGAAAESFAKRFDVSMSKGFVFDPKHSQPGAPSPLIFSRDNKLLLDHPITRGRNETEKINRVQTFTGQALKGPENSTGFLTLSDTAKDAPSHDSTESSSVAGQSQAIAFKFGKGRVVIMGEAAMLSAQVTGPQSTPMGMNVPGNDNKQLALNIMHWLSGLLK